LDNLKYTDDSRKKEKESNIFSQKKNIFYISFKNIKDRYQYREQRLNKIKNRSCEILNEFKLPIISTNGYNKRKDTFQKMKNASINDSMFM
jgi:RAB protein geranylgeranyltransferase component A